jgi:tRNA pseudouridine38-40 synthase
MPNLLLELEFAGWDFFGWQKQPNKRTVQGELEKALSQIFQKKIKVVGVSRLDRGVSALSFFCNGHFPEGIPLDRLTKALNSLLPREIFVKRIKKVSDDFSARKDAKSKIYQYTILLGRSPLRGKLVWELEYPIREERLEEVKDLFLGKKDFAPFVQIKGPGLCEIKRIEIKRKGKEIKIIIEGDRFLYKMVRRIVGALITYARGKITRDDIKNSLAGKPHKPFITAPPQGLVLMKVKY